MSDEQQRLEIEAVFEPRELTAVERAMLRPGIEDGAVASVATFRFRAPCAGTLRRPGCHDLIFEAGDELNLNVDRVAPGNVVPGVMHCAKCKFRLVRTNLNMRDGTATAGDNTTEPCPNGCGPLWPVTWEQEARECWERLEEMAPFQNAFFEISSALDIGAKPYSPMQAMERDILPRIATLSRQATLPTLDDELRDILGRPNFACIELANTLRQCGHDIRRRAEDEQAAVIHWCLGLYLKHGSKWREAGNEEVRRAYARQAGNEAPGG
ncbi:hypothetical protein [Luteimonas saliphila]|uniref:hypothetical protein n=1 Tax=Luteimonas saliphila TaxID=2804919 RepID=UPI00192D92ED|nr:hypothetical protein [Luteimonas saliphila]